MKNRKRFYTTVMENTYQDSIKLMQLQSILKEIPGVKDCGVAMATNTNKTQFRIACLLTEELEKAKPSDLCIVVRVESDEVISKVIEEIGGYFQPKIIEEAYYDEIKIRPKSITSALKIRPDANLAIISVPGDYAAYEASNALRSGLHVFLFSDNVSLEDEIRLKEFAGEKGLLLMGPDCGTAIISRVGLGFSNVVRNGRIGIVGASGSGMQEVCCLVHKMGEGISQAIGTGGRDLYHEVGGKTFLKALDALLQDGQTEVVVAMSKYCDTKVGKLIGETVVNSTKPIVVYFPGCNHFFVNTSQNIYMADHLEHIATLSVAIARGHGVVRGITRDDVYDQMKEIIKSERYKFSPGQTYVRGLFAGGSFVDQAVRILSTFFPRLYVYPADGKVLRLQNPLESKEHSIIDLGDDYFTRGRAHPMIDPSPRLERIVRETEDAMTKIILLDVVLGYGGHPNPGHDLAKVISEAKKEASNRGRYLLFIVSICGTDEDPQAFCEQKEQLESVGAIVTESSTRAAFLAGLIATQ